MTCLLHIVIFTIVVYSVWVSGKCINSDRDTMVPMAVLCPGNGTDNGKGIDQTNELDNTMKVTPKSNGSVEDNKTEEILNGTYLSDNSTRLDIDTYIDKAPDLPYQPKKSQHLTIIIVGSTAAVSIALFLCIAYYFHNAQLNKKAKRLSFTIYVSPEPSLDSVNSDTPRVTRLPKSIPNSPRTSLKLSRETSPSPRFSREASPNAWLTADNADGFGQRRKSTLTGNTLSVPGNTQGKRGSNNWNAFADYEILTLSAPRRHSTFII